jgi:hypothetical protein
VKFNPSVLSIASRYKLRPIDVANNPASAQSLNHFLKSPRVIEFYEWPFDRYAEESKPVNQNLLISYLATINFKPDDMDSGTQTSPAS